MKKKNIEEKIDEIIKFIENNEEAEKEKYEEKEEELKTLSNPIMSKIYQQGASNPNMEDFAQTESQPTENTNAGPKIEEVD